jgi:glutaredoxin
MTIPNQSPRGTSTESPAKGSCTMRSLYLPFFAYLFGLAFFLYTRSVVGTVLWLVVTPCLRWAYIHFFPRIAHLRGYNHMDDKLPSHVGKAPVEVNYYSFVGCPFCPIMEKRLTVLQKEMGFTLHRIDVTLKPQILLQKGIKSVPVVEVGQNRLVGHATTEQLVELIERSQLPALASFAPNAA